MNQGGANVWPCRIRTHLGFRLQPDNMACIALRPKPQVTFKPIEQKDLHQFVPCYASKIPSGDLLP